MSPRSLRLLALSQAALVLALVASPVAANCFDPFKRQVAAPSFQFTTSKQGQVAPGEVKVEATPYRDSFTLTATVSPSTFREVSGTKESQRSEILETLDSSAAAIQGSWLCYGWTMKLAPDLVLPAPGSARAKLTVAQFHQTNAQSGKEPAVLFIDIDPDGNIVALFNDPVGRRSTVLVPGGPSKREALGKEWEVVLAAKWSTQSDGRVVITMREKGQGAHIEVMNDTGQNATTGYVYQKLGVYRHNIERDPAFARSTISVHYSEISRNGVKGSFKGLAGGLSPVTSGLSPAPSSGMAFGSPTSAPTTAASGGGAATAGTRVASSPVGSALTKPPEARIVSVQMGRSSAQGTGRGMTVSTN